MTASRILVVEDDAELLEALTETLESAGYQVYGACDGLAALNLLEQRPVDLIVSDIQMPNMDGHSLLKKVKDQYPELTVMLMTAYGSIQQAVDAMRDGAVDYMVKPFEAEVLVNMVSRYVGRQAHTEASIVAEDPASRKMLNLARRVAQSDATVMITGESGVGKEVLAQFIHQHSTRQGQPFVAINCAAIPENMLEATLFGYEKGAYTGAYKACPGKFEQAQGGTLLLDEITEMDLGLQAKLLRVLQEREVERLGGNRMIALDVRVIATSNRIVSEYVKEGKFREDLFYRLNVFPINISPLKARKGDIFSLVQRMIEQQARQMNLPIPELSATAREKLLMHDWPGNVRELDNVVQRAMVLHQDGMIHDEDIQFELSAETISDSQIETFHTAAVDKPVNDTLNDEMKQKEWRVILSAISSVKGSRKQAAEKLGISQRTLRYKLAKMREAGIEVPGKSASIY